MSNTVDERVVSMQFDNQQFESNVSKTMSTLERLKQCLNLKGASQGLENVQEAARRCDFNPLSSAVETVHAKFSALEVFAVTALYRISNAAISAGKNIVSALTIEPITTGFQEYETQINAVQTILANTASKGTTLEQVNAALDQLNTYADKTIYNFTEMTRNIGTFTAAGVDLDTSVNAIQGIANLAAVSGSTSQQASTAMYQLSQALASGTVKLMDWNSVVNAGMGGQVFQDALKETARVHGIAIDDMITKHGSFRETLQEGWLTSDILTETLQHFTEFTDEYNEETLRAQGYTEEQIEAIRQLGITGTDAATKVKTLTQLWDTLKEAAQSGWTQSWEIIVGDFEEAKALFTIISDTVGEMINKSAEARNNMLQGWKDLGGRTALLDGLANAFNAIMAIVKPVKEAFNDIFPPTTSEQLYNITVAFRNFTEKLILSDTYSKILKNTCKSLFEGFRNLLSILGGVGTALKNALMYLSAAFSDDIFSISTTISQIANAFRDFTAKLKPSEETIAKLGNVFATLIMTIRNVAQAIGSVLSPIGQAFREVLRFMAPDAFSGAIDIFQTIADALKKFTAGLILNEEAQAKVKDAAKGLFSIIGVIAQAFSAVVSVVVSLASSLLTSGAGGGLLNAIVSIIGAFGRFATAVSKAITEANVFGTIAEKLKSILGSIIDSITGFANSVFGSLGGVSGIFDTIAGAVSGLVSIIGELLGKIGENSGGLMSILNTASFAGIALFIKKIADGFEEVTEIPKLLDSVKECLESFQKSLQADTLKKIATAVLMLAAALLVISLIDSDKLLGSLLAVTVLLGGIIGSMELFSRMDLKALKGVTRATTLMLAMSVSVLLLAVALRTIGSLDLASLAKGLIGVAALMGLMILAVKAMTTETKAVMKGATAILAFAVAIKIMASAMKDIAGLSWEGLMKGLIGLTASVALMALACIALSDEKMKAGALQLVALAAAIKILASAMTDMASLSWEGLMKGLIGLTASISLMAIACIALSGEKMKGSALQILAFAAAIKILASAVMDFATLSWEEMAKGLLTLAGTMAILVIALNLMPKNLAAIGAGLLMVSAGLLIMSNALSNLGGMSWGEVAVSLVMLAGSLIILAAGLTLMNGTLAGSAALLVASIALIALATAMNMLGSMSIGEAITSLVMLAATLGIIGAAALLLTPAIPAILAFAAAIALMGVGCLAAGIGITLMAAGIVALGAASLGLAATVGQLALLASMTVTLLPLAATMTVIAAAIAVLAIGSVVAAVGVAGLTLALGLLALICLTADMMAAGLTTLSEALIKMAEASILVLPGAAALLLLAADLAILAVGTAAAAVAMGLFVVALTLLTVLAGAAAAALYLLAGAMMLVSATASTFVAGGISLIQGLASGIGSAAGNVLSALGSVLSSLVQSLISAIPQFFSNAGSFISSMASGIGSKLGEAKNAIGNILTNMISAVKNKASEFLSAGANLVSGLVNGIKNGAASAINAARDMASNALQAAKNALGIQSPSKEFFKVGVYADEGMINGLKKLSARVASESAGVAEGALESAIDIGERFGDALSSDTSASISPVVDMNGLKRSNFRFGADVDATLTKPIGSMSQMMYNAQSEINESNARVIETINGLRDDLSAIFSSDGQEIALYVDSKKLASSIARPMNHQLNIISRREGGL